MCDGVAMVCLALGLSFDSIMPVGPWLIWRPPNPLAGPANAIPVHQVARVGVCQGRGRGIDESPLVVRYRGRSGLH